MIPVSVTFWQILAPGDEHWKVTTPELAAIVSGLRPREVRLVSVPEPAGLAFTRHPRGAARPITPRRIKAAERALAQQVEKAGLFGEHIRQEQPTPLQRVEQFNEDSIEFWREMRRDAVRRWRYVRARLRCLAPEDRASFKIRWNACTYPTDSASAKQMIDRWFPPAALTPLTISGKAVAA